MALLDAYSTTVNYPGLTKDLKVGDPISIDGGMVMMRTTLVNGQRILAEVVTGGEMKSRRHINLPGVIGQRLHRIHRSAGVQRAYLLGRAAGEDAHQPHVRVVCERGFHAPPQVAMAGNGDIDGVQVVIPP